MIMLQEETQPAGNPEPGQTSQGSGQCPGTVGGSDAATSCLSQGLGPPVPTAL